MRWPQNILGFLFLIIVPLHIIVCQDHIRQGLSSVFGSTVLCPAQSAPPGKADSNGTHTSRTVSPL